MGQIHRERAGSSEHKDDGTRYMFRVYQYERMILWKYVMEEIVSSGTIAHILMYSHADTFHIAN